MSECPVCSAGLQYIMHDDVAPGAMEERYVCPDPACEVVSVNLVVAEG